MQLEGLALALASNGLETEPSLTKLKKHNSMYLDSLWIPLIITPSLFTFLSALTPTVHPLICFPISMVILSFLAYSTKNIYISLIAPFLMVFHMVLSLGPLYSSCSSSLFLIYSVNTTLSLCTPHTSRHLDGAWTQCFLGAWAEFVLGSPSHHCNVTCGWLQLIQM